MRRSVIVRLAAASGILYGVMEIVGDSLSTTTSSSSSPSQVAAYFAAHAPTPSTWAGMYIETFGAFAILLFGAYLWSLVGNREDGRLLAVLVLSTAIIQSCVIFAGEPAKAAAFYRAGQGQLDPQSASTLLDLNNASFLAGFMAQAVMVAAASGLALVTGIFSRWLALPGFVVAAALLIVITSPPSSNLPVAVNLVFFLWLAVTSGALVWRAPLLAKRWSSQPAAA